MNTLREAAQQSLKNTTESITALRAALADPQTTHSADCYKWHHECAVAEVERLRAALAEPCPCGDRTADKCSGEWEPGCDLGSNPKYAKRVPVQEPVGCHVFNVTVTGRLHEWEPTTFAFALRDGKHALYTAPPLCPNCASLEAQNTELDRRLAKMEREPVAWRTFDGEGGYDYRTYDDNETYAAEWALRNPLRAEWVEALYLAPPQRKPLTEGEIEAVWMQKPRWHAPPIGTTDIDFARAVEAAHGIIETKIQGDKA